MNLREIPTEVLRRELHDRSHCLDCRTFYSSSWYAAGRNRIRCAECAQAVVAFVQKMTHELDDIERGTR